jgi:hypothetical protein
MPNKDRHLHTHSVRRLVGHQSQSGQFGEQKILLLLAIALRESVKIVFVT